MDLMKNEQFKKIVSEVDLNWSIEERIRYVLLKLGISDQTIIHIVTKGVTIENLYSETLWQSSGFLENYNSKCQELYNAINNFIRNNTINRNCTIEEKIRYKLTELGICDSKVIRIIVSGAKIASLSEYPYHDFQQELKELSSSINALVEDSEPVGILTFIRILQKNIMKDNEIKSIIFLFS